MFTLKLIETRFLEDDVVDGDYPRDDFTETTFDASDFEWDLDGVVGWLALAQAVAAKIIEEGCTEVNGNGSFYYVDGSWISDYCTGERTEPFMQLDGPELFERMVEAAVSCHKWHSRPEYDPTRSRLFEKSGRWAIDWTMLESAKIHATG